MKSIPAAGSVGSSEGSADAEPCEVLTVDEAAAFLRIHPKTLYEAIRNRAVPGVLRLGRAIRISRPALLKWARGTDLPGKPAPTESK